MVQYKPAPAIGPIFRMEGSFESSIDGTYFVVATRAAKRDFAGTGIELEKISWRSA